MSFRAPASPAFAKPSLFGLPALVVSLGLVACGDDKGTGGGSRPGRFSARIAGASWSAEEDRTRAYAFSLWGSLEIDGSSSSGDGDTSLNFDLQNIPGPGTYPLGVGSSVAGGTLQLYITSPEGARRSWATPLSGSAGSVTFTEVGPKSVIGTFTGVLEPLTGAGGEAIDITEGSFDLPLEGSLDPMPGNPANRVIARLNGIPFHAAGVTTMDSGQLVGPGLQFTATTTHWSLNLLLRGVTDTGTYRLQDTEPVRLFGAKLVSTNPPTYWGSNGPRQDTGVVVVLSLTATRAKGTFSATLSSHSADPSAEPLRVTEGEFDIRIP